MTVASHYSVRGFSNTFVVWSGAEAIVIDPGSFDRHLLLLIEENRLAVRAVLLTHGHRSHADGLRTMARIYEFPVYAFAFPAEVREPRFVRVREGERIGDGEIEAECIETPGHSPDSVCYRVGQCLFTGDTLMAGEIGSTAAPADRATLLRSIWSKLLVWPDDTLVFPGHGPPSRIGVERRFNPLLACST